MENKMPDIGSNVGTRNYTVLDYWYQLSLTLCCKNNLILIEWFADKKLLAAF